MGRGLLGVVAAIAALLCMLPATASATHLPGFPECSDGHDNDGDGVADFPGDSNCSGLTDDSEGATSGGGGSEIWVTFLTQWDNGSGGAPDVVCEHSVLAQPGTLLSNLTLTPLDVNQGCATGNPVGADVRAGVSVPANLDTKRPSIKVEKAVGGSLPLRIEVVQVDSDRPTRRETVGYDTLASSAPSSFTAALDLRDQDGRSATEDILVDLTIASASNQIALVTDNYHPGASLNDRGGLHENRLGFRDSDGSDGSSHIPSTAHIDLSTATDRQQIDVSRPAAQPTVLDFLVRRPNDDPKVSGTLDVLPPNIGLDITDEDTAADTDTVPDRKTIVYDADQVVDVATVNVESVRRLPLPRPVVQGKRGRLDTCQIRRCGPPKRIKLHSRVEDLPGNASSEDVKLVYAAADDKINYDASAGVPFTEVTVLDEAPLFNRAKWLEVELTNVPRRLQAEMGSSRFQLDTPDDPQVPGEDENIGHFKFNALQAPPQFPVFCIPVCEDGFNLTDTQTYYGMGGAIHRLKQADITFAPDLDVKLDTAPEMVEPGGCQFEICKRRGLVPIWRTPINVGLHIPRDPRDPSKGQQTISGRISVLQPQSRLQMGKASSTRNQIVYSDQSALGPNSGPDVRLDGINMPDLPKGSNGIRAKDLHVRLKNMPRRLHFSYRRSQAGAEAGGFPMNLEASGTDNILDELDVQMTSGPDERLARDECDGGSGCPIYRRLDGLFSRDTDSKYVIHARISHLKRLFLHKFGDGRSDFLIADMKANAFNDIERALRIDTEKRLRTRFGQDNPQVGTETVKATLDKLPQDVELRAISGPVRTSVEYDAKNSAGADQPVELFSYAKTTTWPNYSVANSGESLRAAPMPAHLDICKMETQPDCADGVFDDNLARVKQGIGLGGINVSPDQANQGSVGIHADPATDFSYFSYPNQSVAFSQVELDDIEDFALQAHQRKFDYGVTDVGAPDGKRGFLAMDTNWDPATEAATDSDAVGTIKVVKNTNNITEFDYPVGWASDQHVFAFERTGLVTGKVIGIGKVNCPSGTYLRAGEDEITDRFCKSRLTEHGFKAAP